MINHYDITSEAWTQITEVGESGTCWLVNNVEGSGNCRVFHSSTPPTLDDVQYGYPVHEPKGPNKYEIISSDNAEDIFYAIIDQSGGTATIVVDVI